jgi:hypothetical protein
MPLMPGITGQLITPKLYSLQGLSQIVEAGAVTVNTTDSEECFLLAEVETGGGAPLEKNPAISRGWLYPVPSRVRRFAMSFDEKKGRKFYLNAAERPKMAEQFDYHWEDE